MSFFVDKIIYSKVTANAVNLGRITISSHRGCFVELQGPGQWTNGIALNAVAVRRQRLIDGGTVAGCAYVRGDVGPDRLSKFS